MKQSIIPGGKYPVTFGRSDFQAKQKIYKILYGGGSMGSGSSGRVIQERIVRPVTEKHCYTCKAPLRKNLSYIVSININNKIVHRYFCSDCRTYIQYFFIGSISEVPKNFMVNELDTYEKVNNLKPLSSSVKDMLLYRLKLSRLMETNIDIIDCLEEIEDEF